MLVLWGYQYAQNGFMAIIAFVVNKVVFILAWLVRNNIFALKTKSLLLSGFYNCADMPLKRLCNSFVISTCELLRHRHTREGHFPVWESSVAEQLCVSPSEVPVKGGIQDGVKGWVKVAQPQHHRVDCIRRISLGLYACPGEKGEVREPADDKSPQHSCQGHCGFTLARYGRCWWWASKGWHGSTNTAHLKRIGQKRLRLLLLHLLVV